MHVLRWVLIVGVFAASGVIGGGDGLLRADDSRPNIVIILADDMGFSDPGCFGGEIETPNIDRLAAHGVRFTEFYNCARCCPTRASLMTGLYPHQVGLIFNGRSLKKNCVTIAEALRLAGYQTAMVGKWHLTHTTVLPDPARHQQWLDHRYDPGIPFGPVDTYPANRGFQRYYGVIWGVIDYFDPFSLVEGTTAVADVPDDYYFTNAITDKAVAYLKEMAENDRPFFLYFAHCAPHWPLHALPEDIAKYRGKYDDGWDALRKHRFDRQVAMGLFDPANTPLPPVMTRERNWDSLTPAEKAFEAAKMETHAAMVDRVDQSIGRVIDTLRECGELENTLIFFLSDNGASPEIPQRPGYDRSSQTREGEPILYSGFERPGPETTYTGIGPAWANAANTPFRYWKKESFEGGCHTPLVVYWPKGLKRPAGSFCDEPGHVMDILPTCLEVAGANYPTQYKGNEILPLEGKSLLPVLRGKSREGHDSLFFEHEGGRAVRQGDWKLVALARGEWELYNLASDRTETKNLADRFPERVEKMAADWIEWARRVGRKLDAQGRPVRQ